MVAITSTGGEDCNIFVGGGTMKPTQPTVTFSLSLGRLEGLTDGAHHPCYWEGCPKMCVQLAWIVNCSQRRKSCSQSLFVLECGRLIFHICVTEQRKSCLPSVLNGIREFQRAHKLFLKGCFERECLAYIPSLKPSPEYSIGMAGQEEKSPVPNPPWWPSSWPPGWPGLAVPCQWLEAGLATL